MLEVRLEQGLVELRLQADAERVLVLVLVLVLAAPARVQVVAWAAAQELVQALAR